MPEPRPAYDGADVVAAYDAMHELFPAEALLFAEHVRPGAAVLDLGVGTGRTVPALSATASSYVGVDISAAMVTQCAARHPGLDFRVGDAADLRDFGDDSFDAVVFSYNGIDHLLGVDRQRCLAECARVLRPGGVLVFSGHNPRAVLVLPRRERGQGRLTGRLVGASALRTARRAARKVGTRAFWTGSGVVHEPVHGGLTLDLASPRRWARTAQLSGFALVQVVGAGDLARPRGWETVWYYYAFTLLGA